MFSFQLPFKNRHWFGMATYGSLILAGSIAMANTQTEIPNFPKKPHIIKATIIDPVIEKENTFQTVLQIKLLANDTSTKHLNTKLLCYIKKDTSFKAKYGDEIVFSATLKEVQNPGNPYEFNYKEYLLHKGITGQCYIDTKTAKITGHDKANQIISIALNARSALTAIYKKHNIINNDFEVLSALTLGDKSALRYDTREQYAKAGAMHILAVSGLHLGIVFFIMNFLLKFLDTGMLFKIIPLKIIKAFLLLIIIWFYAVLTGLSPSVMRAAVMFSFVILGNTLQRQVNIYNSLSASAFFLLLISPNLIHAVGFQMSYLAVISIVYIQQKLVKLITLKNKLLHKIWELTSVSISAQVGTLPISLYYFHMFPNWFILTNLIIIPLATLIIYTATMLLFLAFIPYLADVIAIILKYLIKGLNYFVSMVELLPASTTENIPFNFADSLIAYAIIVSFLYFLKYRKSRHLIITTVFVMLMSMNFLFENYKSTQTLQFTVFNARKSSLYQFVNKGKAIYLQDSTLTKKNFKFATLNQTLKKRFKTTPPLNLHNDSIITNNLIIRRNEFVFFADKIIVLLTQKRQSYYQTSKPAKTDCVVLSGNQYFAIEDVIKLYNPDIIVFDSSNKPNRVERWIEECQKLNAKYHSVYSQGAYILNCKSNTTKSLF